MGGTSSKVARRLPKRASDTKPSWAGARSPEHPDEAPNATARPPPRASEVKNEAIQRDAYDPQLLSNLSKLGAVRVDHHMSPVRPSSLDATSRLFKSRAQSDFEAFPESGQLPSNRLHATTLSVLLDARKSVLTNSALNSLAEQHGVDPEVIRRVGRYVNSPSVKAGAEVRLVGKDGQESVSTAAVWIEPRTFSVPKET